MPTLLLQTVRALREPGRPCLWAKGPVAVKGCACGLLCTGLYVCASLRGSLYVLVCPFVTVCFRGCPYVSVWMCKAMSVHLWTHVSLSLCVCTSRRGCEHRFRCVALSINLYVDACAPRYVYEGEVSRCVCIFGKV